MKQLIRFKTHLTIVLLLGVTLLACNGSSNSGNYNPNELILLLATSNHGEVGPCG